MPDYKKIMLKARKTNMERDDIDRSIGRPAPPDTTDDLFCRIAMSAIECGIKTDDWNAVAEGQAMLEMLELRLRYNQQQAKP